MSVAYHDTRCGTSNLLCSLCLLFKAFENDGPLQKCFDLDQNVNICTGNDCKRASANTSVDRESHESHLHAGCHSQDWTHRLQTLCDMGIYNTLRTNSVSQYCQPSKVAQPPMSYGFQNRWMTAFAVWHAAVAPTDHNSDNCVRISIIQKTSTKGTQTNLQSLDNQPWARWPAIQQPPATWEHQTLVRSMIKQHQQSPVLALTCALFLSLANCKGLSWAPVPTHINQPPLGLPWYGYGPCAIG